MVFTWARQRIYSRTEKIHLAFTEVPRSRIYVAAPEMQLGWRSLFNSFLIGCQKRVFNGKQLILFDNIQYVHRQWRH